MIERLLQVVLAAWAGSLWTICGIVAPSLFAVLPERHVAGQLAGYFFSVATWLGLALGCIAFGFAMARKRRDRFAFVLMAITALAPLIGELALRPSMEAARVAQDMARFGMLHGVSALLFGIACLSAAALVWHNTGSVAKSDVSSSVR